jgi:hypothetical protein
VVEVCLDADQRGPCPLQAGIDQHPDNKLLPDILAGIGQAVSPLEYERFTFESMRQEENSRRGKPFPTI